MSGLAAGLELGNKKIFPRRDGSDAAQLRGLLDLFLVLILQFVLIFFQSPHLHETLLTSYLREFLQSIVLCLEHNAVCYS